MASPIQSLYIDPQTLYVGIGTQRPQARLTVAGHICPASNLVYDLGTSNLRFRDLYLSGNTLNLGGTSITRDPATGGLQVTDPASGNAPLDMTVRTLTASNVSVLGDYVTLNTITSNTEQMVVTNAGTGPALQVTQTGPQPIADFYDDNNALALRIANGGNVGIGTTAPFSKVHINSVVDVVYNSSLTTTGLIVIGNDATSPSLAGSNFMGGTICVNTTAPFALNRGASIALGGRMNNYGGGNQHATFARISGVQSATTPTFAGDFVIETQRTNTGQLFEAVRVTNDGKVGIGTTSPQATLHVQGNILALNVRPPQWYNYTSSTAATSFSIPNIDVLGTRDQSIVFDVTMTFGGGGWGVWHGRFVCNYADQDVRTFRPIYSSSGNANACYIRICNDGYFTKPDPYNKYGTFTFSFSTSDTISITLKIQPIGFNTEY